MQILQKIIICGNISLIIALWTDIFIAYIVLNRISTFLRQFYPGDLANFAGSSIIFSFIAAVIIRIIRKNCCIAVMELAVAPTVEFLY